MKSEFGKSCLLLRRQTDLQRIASRASRDRDCVFTSVVHMISEDLLFQAFHAIRKDAAPGVDGITASKYAENLIENLYNLHQRLRRGEYVAQPVKRVWIDKSDGRKRPLGIPSFEDKIVQKAAEMIMSRIYDPIFYDFSYAFQEDKGQHDALKMIREKCMSENINWIIDADVKSYFDTIDHSKLIEFIKQRLNDGGLIRLIKKWLKAGVIEEGELKQSKTGTPQGGIISPILSNIYLHYVLDEWFEKEVAPRMKGRCFIVRFADDFIVGFESKADAERFMNVLPKRFEKYGLEIHPDKTKMVMFGRPPRAAKKSGKGTFDFLGFTHYWSKSHKGFWVIKRKTRKKSAKRGRQEIWKWIRENMHKPLEYLSIKLKQKLQGYYNYYGVRCNSKDLRRLYRFTVKALKYWLNRRSDKNKNWDKFSKILDKIRLPKPQPLRRLKVV
ncbi:MAG: RNA-directed DNA polymerase [Candidatus Magnetoglobus multicellularis str. Araruama]|uniref:RNA-directed DNA polymerase n=1 Tax=Candidatus Magnetoglobus multicellularis str. Araruama TaxID=890399 RepID=A0A1V1NYG6_9BACT|nr:MAG: RNA-directed DNA polymerase [Candidatus Magnetoglobus multicellularis str. Araruama]